MSEHRKVTLGLVQMSMEEAPQANLAKATAMIREATAKGAKIIALPELFLGPYFCSDEKNPSALERAEPIPGTTTEALGALAAECKIILIGGSIFEKASDGQCFNTACIFGPDGRMFGQYRKLHIPHDPGFYEQNYFDSGHQPISVHRTPYGDIAVGVCYDQWFPEFARIAALKGAELIVYPTAIGNIDTAPVDPAIPENWEAMWRAAQVGHAVSNCMYVAAVNRVGHEGSTHFFGGSFVADPNAGILACGDDTEQVLIAECDLAYPKKMQEAWRFLQERKPEMYGDLIEKK